MNNPQPGNRTSARIAAVQALYEMDMTDAGADPILNEFMANRWSGAGLEDTDNGGGAEQQTLPPADHVLLREIVSGVANHTAILDQHISDALTGGWTIGRLEVLIRAILRAGTYELLHKIDVPVRVVIDEYMGVAHAFFSGTEPTLINGVMDKLAREIRIHEMKVKNGPETTPS